MIKLFEFYTKKESDRWKKIRADPVLHAKALDAEKKAKQKYRQANRDLINARYRERYSQNKEIILAQRKKRREEMPVEDKILLEIHSREYQRNISAKYRDRMREKVAAMSMEEREAYLEKRREYQRKAHREGKAKKALQDLMTVCEKLKGKLK